MKGNQTNGYENNLFKTDHVSYLLATDLVPLVSQYLTKTARNMFLKIGSYLSWPTDYTYYTTFKLCDLLSVN